MFKEYFAGIWEDRYVLFSLVNKDLQLKYRRSKLGVYWSMITPLGLAVIVGSIYSILFGQDPRIFIPSLFAGLNPWIFLSGCADGGTMSFMSAEGYLKQTSTHAQIFPLRLVLVNFVNLLYSMIAFVTVYLFLQPNAFSARMLMCIPGLLIIFVFCVALANLSAIINLNIRDFQPFQSLALQGLFYVTPVIYQPDMMDEKGFSLLYRLNPLYYMIEVVRTPIKGLVLPSCDVYLIAAALAALLFLFSVWVLMRHKREIAFKL